MKNFGKRIIALLLTLLMTVACFAGCSSKGKTLMKIEDTEISVNLYMLYLSRLKGILCSSYAFGSDALSDSFWDTVMSKEGMTYNTYYTDSILENTKTYLAAMYECELRGLELPDETLDEIDARINEFIENDAGGSKTTFNSMLAAYGVNYNILREAYIIEEKIELLKDTVYGVDGELIAKNLIDDYYEQNYARFKQIFFYTYDYVYITDDNGDDIYYNKDGSIAYDTSATPKTDSDGEAVYDSNGDRIYITLNEDGLSRIAYDKKNGTRHHKTDEDGSYLVADLEGEELQAVLDSAAQVMEKTAENDFSGFEALMSSDETYPNGYYMTEDTNYDSPEVVEALFEMEIGEVRMITSDYGVHIIMKYELEEDGYKKDENSDFFISTTTGNYVFMSDIKNQLMSSYLEQHKDKIIIDEALLEGVDMKSVDPNFYY
ncbi:MAG: hypothetical protein IJ011_01410 [Clostridia bacterium]|nr:hypothetical protein [Clostridia bacterium]